MSITLFPEGWIVFEFKKWKFWGKGASYEILSIVGVWAFSGTTLIHTGSFNSQNAFKKCSHQDRLG